ncbi:hypothetical protein GCM10027515_33000 [Schumannella luteola]|uniref:Putative T7SS secretion signal domain-containing protein n=1 Tax=Schumannella luteola TaxID=472059 RepID=A0A852YC38_9MICO|nr:hypothetical protein [Schumannella luteola]NYG98900.1 hypothetical protein [Schumannella luteola]TPX06280.1 hypothetical protein FJ656_01145 [Schumannella luteola]
MADHEYDKLKGEPTLVKSKATHYLNIADAIQRSVTSLKSVQSKADMTSKAVDAVRESAGDVADDIDKAHDRYHNTATALVTYAGKLDTAQSDAETAITKINEKQGAADAAHKRLTTASDAIDDAADEDKADATKAAQGYSQLSMIADSELRSAQDAWRSARDDKDAAARVAITAIVEVVEGKLKHGLEDSFWDDWGDIIKKICEVAGILSIFLGWVPGLGQFLMILGAIGALITLVESVVKALNGGSWMDVAFAAVGVVLSVFGGNIGKYLGKLVKAKGLTIAMKAPRREFKALTGISKGKKGSELADVQHLLGQPGKLPSAMKDIFGTNPFKVKTWDIKQAFHDFRRNPLGVQGFDNPQFASSVANQIKGYQVALNVWNYRGIAGKVESLGNNPLDTHDSSPISLKPDSILKDLAHGRPPVHF